MRSGQRTAVVVVEAPAPGQGGGGHNNTAVVRPQRPQRRRCCGARVFKYLHRPLPRLSQCACSPRVGRGTAVRMLAKIVVRN